MIEHVFDRLNGLDPVNAPESVHVHLDREIRRLGFEHFSFLGLRPRPACGMPVFVNTFPDAWNERYKNKDYLTHDTVLTVAAQSIAPFSWRHFYTERGLSPAELQVLREGRDHGLRYGAAVPVHSPSSGTGILSIANSDSRRTFDDAWRAAWPALQAIAMSCQDGLEAPSGRCTEGRVAPADGP